MGAEEAGVQRWLDAAVSARARARRAFERAACTSSERLAARFEREGWLHLRAATSFERLARVMFDTDELETAITRGMLRASA